MRLPTKAPRYFTYGFTVMPPTALGCGTSGSEILTTAYVLSKFTRNPEKISKDLQTVNQSAQVRHV